MNKTGKHGIGVGFKTPGWKNTLLLSDAAYFFKRYNGTFEDNNQNEYYSSYASFNVNLAYNISSNESFCLIPYAGLGLFYENIDGYMSGKPTKYSGAYNVSIDDSLITLLANIGIQMEYSVSEHLFINGGIKFQWVFYDVSYNNFPGITIGVGYRL
ncbi:hypothetical protein [Carboxylicivirga marina]|uniref:Outer membrane protein beta-barrel domain-containing protein n=1 Tax=Carboxylicivirga marina TaxID=2800988 RepID=A0ABS1HG37_9BACT|nr:hypothetical protein [Carboxylicivirga marina]MBK3516623.1 hypothetical protein [Carboxylicivirga marina]